MNPPDRKLRFSFQTKVLLPVLAVLVLLPTLTFWIVDRYISRQVQDEARQTLLTAGTVFRQSLDIKARDLLTRFRSAVNESSYLSIAQLLGSKDPHATETIRQFLNERLDAYGEDCEALVLASDDGVSPPVAARRNASFDLDDWGRRTALLTHPALQGEMASGEIEFHGRAYLVVSVPVALAGNGSFVGALTVANRITESALQELRLLTGAEIILTAGDKITVSTLRQPELPPALQSEISRHTNAPERIQPVEIRGEHFLALTSDYDSAIAARTFRYVLLYSYEQRLRELDHTRTTLLGVTLLGVVVGGLMVWFLLRRVTQPLVELRDNAEAVGRGDFTRRIQRFSDDECGEVAEAFNRMTGNLQNSRADLEKAVATIKTTEAQLIQSEKLSAVGQFVAGIAHELNNPLTTVIGFSDLLQHTELEPKYKNQIDRIASAATRCHKIVHSLLGFARQHEPERKLARLPDVVDAVVEFLSYDMRTNNITIVREYGEGLPPIMADAHQLQQVILNILSNARQAIEAFRRDGRIVLRTGKTDTHVWLRIIDNGPGMARETLSRIFDPFFTTKPQGKGTGLGLSLSYGIIQEHQGTIRAESVPGQGAEFIIELPIAQVPADGVPVKKDGSLTPFRSKVAPMRILVVDDEEPILHLIQEVLRIDGHAVDTATSGLAALELAAQTRYDVIVTDWKMPGLNGMQVHEDLSARDPGAARRMLFMTGDVIGENFQDFLKMNSLTCLPKPFSLREFQSAIARLQARG